MEDTREKRSNEVMEGQSETGAGNISISPSTHHCSTSKTVLRAGRYASNTFLFLLFPDIKLKRVPTVCQRMCLNTKEAHSTTVEISTRYSDTSYQRKEDLGLLSWHLRKVFHSLFWCFPSLLLNWSATDLNKLDQHMRACPFWVPASTLD